MPKPGAGPAEEVPARQVLAVLEQRIHGASLLGDRLVEVQDQLRHGRVGRQLAGVETSGRAAIRRH